VSVVGAKIATSVHLHIELAEHHPNPKKTTSTQWCEIAFKGANRRSKEVGKT